MTEYLSNNDRGYRLRLWIDQVSQDISANSSQVRVRLYLLNTTTTFSGYYCQAFVDLAGQRLNWSATIGMTSNNSTLLLIDNTITVAHNADGTKSFGLMASFSGSGGYSPGILDIGSSTFTLATIPRSSSVSVGAGTIGSAVTITINRQSTSFKHTLRYSFGNKSGTIASNVDTSYSWTIPADFANEIPNSTSGTGTIYVDTYSGSTLTGTQSASLSAAVAASVKPTFTSFSLSDNNSTAQALIPDATTFIQVISNLKVTFTGATGAYGSTITGYKAEIVGKNQSTSSNGGSLGIMNYNGSVIVRASVMDSRGRQSDTKDISITVLEYFAPALSFSITRTGSSSSTLTVSRNAKVAALTVLSAQKNTMTLSFKVAEQGSTTYTDDTGAAGSWTNTSSLVNASANMSGTYAANKSYVVLGTLTDKFQSATFTAIVATESVVYSYDKSGVGVGKVRERGTLDVNGSGYFSGAVYAENVTASTIKSTSALANSFALDAAAGYLQLNKTGNTFSRIDTESIRSIAYVNDIDDIGQVATGTQYLEAGLSRNSLLFKQYGATRDETNLKASARLSFDGKKIYSAVPLTQGIYSGTFAGPWGKTWAWQRNGNMVTLQCTLQGTGSGTITGSGSNSEAIPNGARPATNTNILAFWGAKTFVFYALSNGSLEFNALGNSINIADVLRFTCTYITGDDITWTTSPQ